MARCAAWEAARRGLRVALVEAATSAMPPRATACARSTAGLRYLQQLDFKRMRESIRERREWLRSRARHRETDALHPAHLAAMALRGPAAMAAALFANDLVSIDRNDGVWADRHLPRGEVWRARRARQVFAGHIHQAHQRRGGLVRRHLPEHGTAADRAPHHRGRGRREIANYTRAVEIRRDSIGASGVRVRDEPPGREHTAARAGDHQRRRPLGRRMAGSRAGSTPGPRHYAASKAFNLLTRPLPFVDAIALPCSSTYFAIPWNGRTLIGTRHLRCPHDSTTANVTADEVQAFLADINTVLGKHRITPSDVLGVFSGLLPGAGRQHRARTSRCSRPRASLDHGVDDGMPGLYSIVGIKWTTARAVAERAIKMACEWMCVAAEPRSRSPAEARGARHRRSRDHRSHRARALARRARGARHTDRQSADRARGTL